MFFPVGLGLGAVLWGCEGEGGKCEGVHGWGGVSGLMHVHGFLFFEAVGSNPILCLS